MADDKHAVGQFKVMLNNPCDAEKLYRLGVEIQKFDDGIGFVMTRQMDVKSIENNIELLCREIVDINEALDIPVTVTCMQCLSLILRV